MASQGCDRYRLVKEGSTTGTCSSSSHFLEVKMIALKPRGSVPLLSEQHAGFEWTKGNVSSRSIGKQCNRMSKDGFDVAPKEP